MLKTPERRASWVLGFTPRACRYGLMVDSTALQRAWDRIAVSHAAINTLSKRAPKEAARLLEGANKRRRVAVPVDLYRFIHQRVC